MLTYNSIHSLRFIQTCIYKCLIKNFGNESTTNVIYVTRTKKAINKTFRPKNIAFKINTHNETNILLYASIVILFIYKKRCLTL